MSSGGNNVTFIYARPLPAAGLFQQSPALTRGAEEDGGGETCAHLLPCRQHKLQITEDDFNNGFRHFREFCSTKRIPEITMATAISLGVVFLWCTCLYCMYEIPRHRIMKGKIVGFHDTQLTTSLWSRSGFAPTSFGLS